MADALTLDGNNMLDDVEEIDNIDKSNMLDVVADFPSQIEKASEIIKSAELENIYKVDNIVFSGMGGSAISGDILQAYFRDKIDIPIYVNRQYDLPRWVNKDSLVFIQSYSGNTEETLSAFKHAYQKRSKIIAITSNGKLEEFCKKRQINLIKIPQGYQPRAATGFMLFSALYALIKTGVIRLDIDKEINETIKIAKEVSQNNNKKIEIQKNYAKQLANKIIKKTPQIYSFKYYNPIAKRWCTQFNENSKIICRYDEVSESNHNDIVGWSMNPEVTKNFTCILFRDKAEESVYIEKRLEFMKKLFKTNAADTIEIEIEGKKRLSKMMYTMYLGDFVSCYLAILRKIDPTPVNIISELKEELTKI